ncbi:glutathione S-transferase family protein [Sphingomonas sp. ID0503]|uniref:glutathione S-transferase family protein n=1 Tax=Sphingomonas sp. ID0503 TaxID=3399691 RepID=UPI003AFAF8B4
MLTVHHLGISQSERVVWLCEELGLPYDLVIHARDAETMLAPDAYRALHPAGTAPVIVDGDVVLGESGAILEYVARKHGGGRFILGPDDANFAEYLYWFHFSNASLMANGMIEVALGLAGADSDNTTLSGLRGRLDRAYAMIETRLGQAEWFAGDRFTLADIMMAFPLGTMRMFTPYDISGLPAIQAYLKRVSARPAFQATRAKADPQLPVELT